MLKTLSAAELIKCAAEAPKWIVQDLIEDGDEVILAAAAKSRKTFLAIQLALAIARGEPFLRWRVPRPLKTLYVNFELRDRVFGMRVLKLVGGPADASQCKNFTATQGLHRIDVLDAEQRQALAEDIARLDPAFIVWDVLARMHAVDENQNMQMASVMQSIREASAGRAHLIVHHMRKAMPGENWNPGAQGMRGASAIHGEVDLVMGLHLRRGQGARYSVEFSARNVETPSELLLDIDPATQRFVEVGEAQQRRHLRDRMEAAFGPHPVLAVQKLHESLLAAQTMTPRRAQQLIREAVQQGWLVRQGSGRNTEYRLLPASFPEAA